MPTVSHIRSVLLLLQEKFKIENNVFIAGVIYLYRALNIAQVKLKQEIFRPLLFTSIFLANKLLSDEKISNDDIA